MNWEETYPTIATELAATVTDRTDDMTHLKNVLYALVNLTTEGDGSNDGYGREAVTTLMEEMYHLYNDAERIFFYDPIKFHFVESINSFTVKYFGDLTTFVNNLIWEDGCIPIAWAELTEHAGRDTSEWNLCS